MGAVIIASDQTEPIVTHGSDSVRSVRQLYMDSPNPNRPGDEANRAGTTREGPGEGSARRGCFKRQDELGTGSPAAREQDELGRDGADRGTQR